MFLKGHGNNESESLPQQVIWLKGKTVTRIAAGWRHTLALTVNGQTQESTLYAWGDNSSHQLGIGAVRSANTPNAVIPASDAIRPAPLVKPFRPVGIAAGFCHSLCVTGMTYSSHIYPERCQTRVMCIHGVMVVLVH